MSYELRLANEQDLNKIKVWLEEQDGETFLCNFDLTTKQYDNKELLVYFDLNKDIPIAYLWLDFGILEVKQDYQNKGIGKEFVKEAIEYIKKNSDRRCLYIECTPDISIPFWKKQGFTIYAENYAYFIIDEELNLPNKGQPVDISIKLYEEGREWDKNIQPLKTLNRKGKKIDNIIYLNEIIVICSRFELWKGRDVYIEIFVDKNIIYKDKAKRSEGAKMGIENVGGSFIIKKLKEI